MQNNAFQRSRGVLGNCEFAETDVIAKKKRKMKEKRIPDFTIENVNSAPEIVARLNDFISEENEFLPKSKSFFYSTGHFIF